MRVASALFILGCLLSISGAQSHEETIQVRVAPTPARLALEQMSPAERKNSEIAVEFHSSDKEAVLLGSEVERLWNSGEFDKALAQLGDLETRVGHVAVGNSWRAAVPTIETSLWGQDVRISNRDSLLGLAFDADDSTGNLFAVLRRTGLPHYSVCMSTDSGATWNETFVWSGSPPTSVNAMVLTNHLYVAYNSPEDDPQHIRLRRFLCSNGRADTFSSGGNWVTACTLDAGDTMKEVSLTSNQMATTVWLYLAAIISDGSVRCGYDYQGRGSWRRMSTGITSGASQGLDFIYNRDGDSSHYFISYYDASDTLRIWARASGGFTQRFSLLTGRGFATSLSGRGDTVICAYEDGVSSPHRVRYVINCDDGDTWTIGTLSNADTAANAPAVALGGGGFAAVYRHCSPTRELRFRRRSEYGAWSAPVAISDHEPYWCRPAVKCLDTTGVFGVVYLSNTSPVVRGAYFDRSLWAHGVAEQRRLLMDDGVLGVAPNPLKGIGRLNYMLDHPAELRVQVLDRTGRLVRTLFSGRSSEGRHSLSFDAAGIAPGVYFIRADADGRALTVPLAVAK